MDRAEATGLGVALGGHGVLLAALALGLANARLPALQNEPMEVSFVEDVGLETRAPQASDAPAAPRVAEIEGPVEPLEQVEPIRPLPEPLPSPPKARSERPPAPNPRQRPVERRQAQNPPAAQPKQGRRDARPTGRRLDLDVDGLSDNADSKAAAPRAQAASPAQQASLRAEMRRQLKPHWKSPTGADADQLRTELRISLAPDGTVTQIEVIGTTGQTASNRPQIGLHQERAKRAVALAQPFTLPREYYGAWKQQVVSFDKRLSQ